MPKNQKKKSSILVKSTLMIKYPIGIFISGRGSNLKSIINASKDANFPGQYCLSIF